jgi:exosome complex component RRP4
LLARGRYKAGQNVIKVDDAYYATVVGSFEIRERGVIAVRALKGPYMPKKGDKVIGAVIDVSMGSWSVDIRSPYVATLPASRFSSRINPTLEDIRNYLNVGDYVYCEIAEFDRFHSPVLDASISKEFGPVKKGVVIPVEPTRVPRIIGKKGSMLQLLNKELNVKLVVAQNGYVWIPSDDASKYKLVIEVIRKIETEAHLPGLTDRIEKFLKTVTLNKDSDTTDKQI